MNKKNEKVEKKLEVKDSKKIDTKNEVGKMSEKVCQERPRAPKRVR